MKRCPTCNRSFSEPNLSFCIDDGTPLVEIPDEDSTVVSPPSESSKDSGWDPLKYRSDTAPYQPPSTFSSPEATGKRNPLPWVIGLLALILIVVLGFGVAAIFLLPNLVRQSANANQASSTTESNTGENSNANTDPNANTNLGAAEPESSNPPTNEEQVLAALTELEQAWTVANINADKKALDKILADDYVGKTEGRVQGKAEYIATIQRDTLIEKWDFEDLKVSLSGDRATLTGIIKYVVRGQDLRFRFVDKFVWRDGRWQATGSEVNEVTDVNNK